MSNADRPPSAADKPYARLEYLLDKITDRTLRSELERETGKIRMHKKFGLVFEEHLPEHVRLYQLPLQVGSKVVKRDGQGDEVFVVQSLTKKKVTIIHELDGRFEEVDPTELVSIKKFGEPIYPSLIPVDCVTRAKDKPFHSVINAENFHALQLLLYCYAGQIDVIYIDPPYNTGARDWKYNNNYVDNSDQYRHSKWLSMMKKRIVLGSKLLKKNGIMVIAIDDNEIHHLRSLLEDIVGAKNFLGCVVVRSKPSGNQTEEGLAVSHEYALFVGNDGKGVIHPFERSTEQLARFDEEDEQGKFWWENFRRAGANSRRIERPKMFYPIWVLDSGKLRVPKMEWDESNRTWVVTEKIPQDATEVLPTRDDGDERIWSYGPETAAASLSELKLETSEKGIQIYRKRRMNRPGVLPSTTWIDKKYSATEYGTNIVSAIFGEANKFPFPKSIYTVLDCIRCASDNPNALILDFFAGSGTTYQATCLLNAEDGGSRRCILVTNNEVAERQSKVLLKKGIFPGDKRFEKFGICEDVTWPRCKFITLGKRGDGKKIAGEYLNGGKIGDGFDENIQYFRLDYLDPYAIQYREKLADILPMLWLTAGGWGECGGKIAEEAWFIPKNSPYAVLIRESSFATFRKELKERPNITHVFLVTDSEEAFRDMCTELPSRIKAKMLYKSYLDNFRINIPLIV